MEISERDEKEGCFGMKTWLMACIVVLAIGIVVLMVMKALVAAIVASAVLVVLFELLVSKAGRQG